jgi:glutamate synthase domain-containing protein 3
VALVVQEVEQLEALVREHQRRTGSPKAARLLADWHWHAARFIKLVPPPPQVKVSEGPVSGSNEERRVSHG